MRAAAAAVAAIAFWCTILPATAIYKDDVGVLDFSVPTAGHGAIGWASQQREVLLTSEPSSSCYVAGRNIEDGSLLWRRNVCVLDDREQAHGIAVGNDAFYTVEKTGVVRAWTVENGDLLWENKVASSSSSAKPKLFAVDGYVAVTLSEQVFLLDSASGDVVDTIRSSASVKDGQTINWFSVEATASSTLTMAFAKVSDGIIASGGSDFHIGTYQVGTGGNLKSTSGQIKGKNILADTVKVGSNHVWAVTASGSVVHNTDVSEASDWNQEWNLVVKVDSIADGIVSLSGKSNKEAEATMVVFRSSGSSWKRVLDSNNNAATAVCPTLGLIAATPVGQAVQNYDLSSGKPLKSVGDAFGSDGDSVSMVSVAEEGSTATVLIGT